MAQINSQSEIDFPFPVPSDRFDQKNEMFKRSRWDPKMKPLAARFYQEVKYKETAGYQKMDYALRNASWNLEWNAALGNSSVISAFMPGKAFRKKSGILLKSEVRLKNPLQR
jgi:hypothetical protein